LDFPLQVLLKKIEKCQEGDDISPDNYVLVKYEKICLFMCVYLNT
jgi:hypothetical protein